MYVFGISLKSGLSALWGDTIMLFNAGISFFILPLGLAVHLSFQMDYPELCNNMI